MAAAKPWMKFYPRDWRADEKLRDCSLAARGLWIEMLAIMHASERYGRLLVAGKPPTAASLGRQVGASSEEVEALLGELRAADVFSTDASGIIYSRRMKSDEKRAENARKVGKRGGNPKLLKQSENSAQDNGTDNGTLKAGDKLRGQSPDTVLNSTAADAADADKIFWANAKAFLQPHCRGDAGALIGAWLRDNGKELTAAAINAAQLEKAVNPVEYCQGYFRRHRKEPPKPRGAADPRDVSPLVRSILAEKGITEATTFDEPKAAGAAR